jgi:hypothetical protein
LVKRFEQLGHLHDPVAGKIAWHVYSGALEDLGDAVKREMVDVFPEDDLVGEIRSGDATYQRRNRCG